MGERFSATIHTSPGAHPAFCTRGTGSLSWRWSRTWCWPPTLFRTKVRVQLYLYFPSGPSWPVIGRPLLLPRYHIGRDVPLEHCQPLDRLYSVITQKSLKPKLHHHQHKILPLDSVLSSFTSLQHISEGSTLILSSQLCLDFTNTLSARGLE